MRVLFLHQNFPAQFVHIAQALKRRGDDLRALVPSTNQHPRLIPTTVYPFEGKRDTMVMEHLSHYSSRVDRGMVVADALQRIEAEGFVPDVVIGHGGWGETLFVKDVWPSSKLLLHAELCYTAEGGDVGFDPEFSTRVDRRIRSKVRLQNTAMLQALLDADQGIAPTQWQAATFPPILRSRIHVLHEGIATELIRPDPTASVTLQREKITLRPGDEIVTFVARNLEPHRGYHVFMRALPNILRRRPKARAVIVGGDEVSYGRLPAAGRSWKQVLLEETGRDLDLSRVHHVGRVPYPAFIRLMQVSAAHVYLTYPFVLSWSVLEAMSAGSLVVGSRTPPVEEVIQDGKNGLLRDFFDVAGIAEVVIDALAKPAMYLQMRDAAREQVVKRFDLQRVSLPGWLQLIDSLNEARM